MTSIAVSTTTTTEVHTMSTPILRATLVLGALLGAIPVSAQGQGTTISGTVTSDQGTPLQAVSVSIPALNAGGVTNETGRYSFTVPAAQNGKQVVIMAR